MISLERCKKILNLYNEERITDDELRQLRSLLADWAKIAIEIEENMKYDTNEECSSICARKHR